MAKSSITFRVCKKQIQVYRQQSRRQSLIFKLDHDLANTAELELLLANEIERNHWEQFRQRHAVTQRQQWLQQLIDRGLDKVMGDIADALELLAKDDPSGQQPKNRQCGYGIWHEWDRITRIVASVSHWGIKQAEAKQNMARADQESKRDEQRLATTSQSAEAPQQALEMRPPS